MKCSDVRRNGAAGNLNGVRPNERVVQCSVVEMGKNEVSTSVLKWSEGLTNKVLIITSIYTD